MKNCCNQIDWKKTGLAKNYDKELKLFIKRYAIFGGKSLNSSRFKCDPYFLLKAIEEPYSKFQFRKMQFSKYRDESANGNSLLHV